MTEVVLTFRKNSPAKRENRDFGLENALAGWVRREFPDKTIPHVAHYFDLSDSEAAKVVYAQASKNTLKKLLHHKRGGFGLFVELLADACNTSLELYLKTQAERAADERKSWEARQRSHEALLALVSDAGLDAGRSAEPARRLGTRSSGLG